MKLLIEFKDGGAVEAEAEDMETVVTLMNQGLYSLWGNSARQLSLMTLDEADKTFGMNPRGRQ